MSLAPGPACKISGLLAGPGSCGERREPSARPQIELKTKSFQSLCDHSNIFVGRGFSHDMSPAISGSALAPEDLKRSHHTDSFSPPSRWLSILRNVFCEPAFWGCLENQPNTENTPGRGRKTTDLRG